MREWKLRNEVFLRACSLKCPGDFSVCTIIDQVRIVLLERPFLTWFDKNTDKINGIIRIVDKEIIKSSNSRG